ncbi:MAG TPA: hypothetical protein VNN72_06510 [Polyangiaceae bacterium]|nr:hypothetical protein [Polyangiaceae bacterium]
MSTRLAVRCARRAARGKTDYVSVPVASNDGLTCSIAQIILRAEGID